MDNQAVETFIKDQNPDGNNQNKAIFLNITNIPKTYNA